MIAGLIQARLDSERLPGKALLDLGGKKIIEHCINAVKKSQFYTPILVTSKRTIDDPLVEVALSNNILFFRGSFSNVAKRALDCINYYNVSYFARVNGDSPFTHYSLLDFALLKMLKNEYDFVTNVFNRTFPYGISVELLDANCYRKCFPLINSKLSYKEHYTKYFYENKENLNFYSIENARNQANYSLTIDTKEDYEKAQNLINKHPDIMDDSLENLLTKLEQL